MNVFYERWRLDSRFWYVCFSSYHNEFNNGTSGPCLAVVNDFGDLVPTAF